MAKRRRVLINTAYTSTGQRKGASLYLFSMTSVHTLQIKRKIQTLNFGVLPQPPHGFSVISKLPKYFFCIKTVDFDYSGKHHLMQLWEDILSQILRTSSIKGFTFSPHLRFSLVVALSHSKWASPSQFWR